MNQRLRKTLQPKNAIMVLNEMKAGVQFTFPETQGPMPNSLYLVHAEVTMQNSNMLVVLVKIIFLVHIIYT